MALADVVLEGLTLILVIALGAVLIGGLSYLATTTASANNARLITAGTYVYLPGPTYINGTLYVPMYNIGRYAVQVRYIFIRGPGGVSEYPVNISLGPGQYYVYELGIDYAPSAVTIVVSPINDPGLTLEFSANVTTPGPITPAGTSLSAQGCPVLASVSDPYNAGWQVSWTMAGSTYSVSKSASYEWCIVPPYYPITINFQASITSSPNGYQCSITPQTAQVNYEGRPETQSFAVTCQHSQSSPPGGGNNNNNYFVYVTVTGDSYGAGWEVSSGIDYITGTGNVNNTKLAISGPGITIRAWITSNPSEYTCSISPSSYSNVQNGSTYTFTVSCQPITTSGPYCIVNPSASDNVGGESGAYVSPSTTQYIPPGQFVLFTWAIRNNPVQYNGQTYYFNNWAITLNGKTVKTDQTSSTYYEFQCPSNLSSNQTYTLSGEAVYWERYLKVGGGNTFNVPGSGTYPVTSQYTTAYFYWSDPLFISGSWNIQYQQGGGSFTISVTLNDFYSESGTATQLSASTTLAIAGPTGYICYINNNGINPSSGSITSAQASNWLPTTAQVSVTCTPQGKGW